MKTIKTKSKAVKAWAIVKNRSNYKIGGYQCPSVNQIPIFTSKQACNKYHKCIRVEIREVSK